MYHYLEKIESKDQTLWYCDKCRYSQVHDDRGIRVTNQGDWRFIHEPRLVRFRNEDWNFKE